MFMRNKQEMKNAIKPQQVNVQRTNESSSWIKDWYTKQEQKKRMVETYENHEMEVSYGQRMSCLV